MHPYLQQNIKAPSFRSRVKPENNTFINAPCTEDVLLPRCPPNPKDHRIHSMWRRRPSTLRNQTVGLQSLSSMILTMMIIVRKSQHFYLFLSISTVRKSTCKLPARIEWKRIAKYPRNLEYVQLRSVFSISSLPQPRGTRCSRARDAWIRVFRPGAGKPAAKITRMGRFGQSPKW